MLLLYLSYRHLPLLLLSLPSPHLARRRPGRGARAQRRLQQPKGLPRRRPRPKPLQLVPLPLLLPPARSAARVPTPRRLKQKMKRQ